LKDLRKFPVRKTSLENQKPVIQAVERMLKLYEEFNNISDSFLKLVKLESGDGQYSRILKTWYLLNVKSFISSLEKDFKPQKLSNNQKREWVRDFEAEKTKILAIKTEIDHLDARINQMVYELYELTEEEIAVVEYNDEHLNQTALSLKGQFSGFLPTGLSGNKK
jgi:hypothetical protein